MELWKANTQNLFFSEINVMSVINHPFIVNMIGHFQDESRVYIVLEYVQGGGEFQSVLWVERGSKRVLPSRI